jgi:hypothetical protein
VARVENKLDRMEDPDSKILFLRQPDPFEQSVRLVCGALLGVVIGGYAWVRFPLSWPAGAAVTAAAIVLCAVCARKYGDDFWYGFFESWAWPWGRR